MTSPLFATVGSGLILKENVGIARWGATLSGFIGAMIILEPWADGFNWAALLPVGAAFSGLAIHLWSKNYPPMTPHRRWWSTY